MARLLLSTNTAWNITNFRLGVIRALQAAGHEIICAAPPDEYVTAIEAVGCTFCALPMDNQGTSPLRDLNLLRRYRALMKAERIDAYLSWTPKPNIYGALAARSLSRPAIMNVSGLGVAFSRSALLRHIVLGLYKASIASANHVFFQNEDNRAEFEARGLVTGKSVEVLPGSGVDLTRFNPADYPERPQARPRVFLMVCRMLWDKGVGEYVDAARQAKAAGLDCEFRLLGKIDVANPSAIGPETVTGWVRDGVVRYLGEAADVRPHLADADVVVLPSYYPEGTPKSLLEAMAMAKAIITTDTPGCRSTVEPDLNGYLCRPRNSDDLFRAVNQCNRLSSEVLRGMGAAGRRKAESEFDEALIAQRYVDRVTDVLGSGN